MTTITVDGRGPFRLTLSIDDVDAGLTEGRTNGGICFLPISATADQVMVNPGAAALIEIRGEADTGRSASSSSPDLSRGSVT